MRTSNSASWTSSSSSSSSRSYPSSSSCRTALAAAALLLSHLPSATVRAASSVFTYYDDAFVPPGSAETLRVGPSSWSDLLVSDNQCGGTDQVGGYGQSPVVVPRSAVGKCDSNLEAYEFMGGNCKFGDLDFHVVNNGVVVAPPNGGGGCSLGKMKIPGNDNWYEARHVHIRSGSEHSVGGMFHPAELHIVHKESGGGGYAIFAAFIAKDNLGQEMTTDGRQKKRRATTMSSTNDTTATGEDELSDDVAGNDDDAAYKALEGFYLSQKTTTEDGQKKRKTMTNGANATTATGEEDTMSDDVEGNDDAAAYEEAVEGYVSHQLFEYFLQGWEAVSTQTEQFCAATPRGSGVFTPNRLYTSKQQLVECRDVAYHYTPNMVADLEWSTAKRTNPITDESVTEYVPELEISPDFPSGLVVPSLYESLAPTGAGEEKDALGNVGMYTYRGGLTTPPCTENVHWSILDEPVRVSSSQLDRLVYLTLCFVERSTCRHSTVADRSGEMARPPQELNGRTILHRCGDGPAVRLVDPPSPVIQSKGGGYKEDGGHHAHPHYALLYPWFVMALGFIVYYLLSRFAHFIPYTAVMFVLGTFMGIGIVALENTDQLSTSARMWANINAEVLLLVFLPGLLFRDAYCLNVYLLKDALVQCLIMAFPMVLAGTVLLALVGFYILPYGWSFSLCMTFGAILSATDPVAVSALLNEVGAPPRLKMHIAGESLLNDGSAIVFFTLFGSMFLYELGIPGLGKDVDALSGVALFFRMSLGAAAVGLAFGLALVRILHHFSRRFQAEESIVQVTSTITIAYLTYYVAEPVCHTSGVIAVVTCGVVTKTFGENLINDKVMMEKFWLLVEHLLNTLIFALGGAVWGTVISNSDPRRSETFSALDWGYLFLLYVLIFAIRSLLFAAFFPVIGRIGLKSNWKEAAFISFGGLRGAVGIAMAIALDNELRADTVPGDPRRDFTSQLFGLTGGISFLTLIINGSLCGPLLRKLGLADSTEMREKIVKEYRHGLMQHVLDSMLTHLSDPRFEKADFAIIRRHVPALRDVSSEELKLAVKRQKANTPSYEYKKPNLDSFRGFIGETSMNDIASLARVSSSAMLQGLVARTTLSNISLQNMVSTQREDDDKTVDDFEMMELRKLFIELLRFAYKQQIEDGEVEVREGLVVFTLEKSLEYASDAVANWEPLCDWEKMQRLSHPLERKTKEILDMPSAEISARVMRRASIRNLNVNNNIETTEEDKQAVGNIQRAVAFIAAHQTAQKTFKDKFCGNRLLTASERQLLDESRNQVSKAEELLQSTDSAKVDNTISHLLCTILLNSAASYIGNLVTNGLLKEMEGEEYLHEFVVPELHAVRVCMRKKECTHIHGEEAEQGDDGHAVAGANDKGAAGGEGGRDLEGGFVDEPPKPMQRPSLRGIARKEKGGSNIPRVSSNTSRFAAPDIESVKEESEHSRSFREESALSRSFHEEQEAAATSTNGGRTQETTGSSFYLNPKNGSSNSIDGAIIF